MKAWSFRSMAWAWAIGAAALLAAAQAQALSVGDKAPAFSLPATIGKQASNKDFAGKSLVLFFYTGAFTNS
jgi:thioredoxin-dependent peroxiredoxin